MRTIKVNIGSERARYHALMDAMISQEEIEGGYVMLCLESRDQGERVGKFHLRDADDMAPYFVLAPEREG